MKAFATILLICIVQYGYSQLNINLSPKHQSKLSAVKSGHKRAKQFYKFFRRDSIKHLKRLNKQIKRSWDSVARANRSQYLNPAQVSKLNRYISKETVDSLDSQIRKWKAILNDSTSGDSLKAIAKSRAKDLTITRLRYDPGYPAFERALLDRPDSSSWTEIKDKMPGIDSLEGIFSDPGELLDHSIKMSEHHLEGFATASAGTLGAGDFSSAKELENSYGGTLKDANNITGSLKSMDGAMSKQGVDSVLTNNKVLEAATQKVSHLFSKFTSFSSSSDLSDAKKRTSLEGKTFLERIVIGGTFNVVSTDPVSIDFAPQIGYRFTSLFTVGVGMNYRATFGDSINYSWHVSSRNIAVKAFTSYEFINSWFLTGESQFSSLGKNESNKTDWNANYFIGIGKKFLVHPKLHMTLTALYNLNSENQNQLYPQRFQIRVGFQTSDLAFRKKQVNYDPNR